MRLMNLIKDRNFDSNIIKTFVHEHEGDSLQRKILNLKTVLQTTSI